MKVMISRISDSFDLSFCVKDFVGEYVNTSLDLRPVFYLKSSVEYKRNW